MKFMNASECVSGNRQPFISRRMALAGSTSALFSLSATFMPIALRAEETYSDPVAADRWLLPLIHAPGASAGALHMGRFRDSVYYLDRDIKWLPGADQDGPTVVVPAGFVTDLASIPRIFWSLLPRDGAYTFPAIVHDYLYWTQEHPRKTADRVFRYGMDDMNISTRASWAIYSAVRVGGKGAWDNNAKLKQAGEMRMLKEFPSDPSITWSEWKMQKGCCSAI